VRADAAFLDIGELKMDGRNAKKRETSRNNDENRLSPRENDCKMRLFEVTLRAPLKILIFLSGHGHIAKS
jgi:hypothetical protein